MEKSLNTLREKAAQKEFETNYEVLKEEVS